MGFRYNGAWPLVGRPCTTWQRGLFSWLPARCFSEFFFVGSACLGEHSWCLYSTAACFKHLQGNWETPTWWMLDFSDWNWWQEVYIRVCPAFLGHWLINWTPRFQPPPSTRQNTKGTVSNARLHVCRIKRIGTKTLTDIRRCSFPLAVTLLWGETREDVTQEEHQRSCSCWGLTLRIHSKIARLSKIIS